MFLSRTARSVTLVVRAASLDSSMSHYLVEQVTTNDRIRVLTRTEVVEAVGDGHLEQLVLQDCDTGAKQTVDTGWLFVFIGAAPHTGWLEGTLARDEHGFVRAGHDLLVDGHVPASWPLDRPPYHLETSVPGVFAAGDVRAESAKRVASAVGEGAMAVMLVHRYLEQL
jgi:thioredoxin reductase (NADPH)